MAIEQLTKFKIDAWVKKAEKGRLYDGGNLALEIGATGKASWIFAYTSPTTGKRRTAGLGSLDVVGLAAAREKAKAMRVQLDVGLDPLQARAASRAKGMLFKEAAQRNIDTLRKGWTVEDIAGRYEKAIETHCADIANLAVADITRLDIANVLNKIEKQTTRRFVQDVIRKTFDWVIAAELRADNPAERKHIQKLVHLKHTTTHQKALHYSKLPAFVQGLRAKNSNAARCLEFILRTGLRRNEAIKLRFDEIDFAGRMLHLEKERVKQRRAHSLPLPEGAFRILLAHRVLHPESAFVFPGSFAGVGAGKRSGRAAHLSHGAFQHLLLDDMTTHGTARSSMRDYLGSKTDVSFETAEDILGHKVGRGDPTVAAYRRERALDKMREALELWGAFLDGGQNATAKPADNVLNFKQERVPT